MNVEIKRESDESELSHKSGLIPIDIEEAAKGLMAIGGCRQCSRTFTDRLELIHHFVDHFPAIFYSFEELNQHSVPESNFFSLLAELLKPKDDTQKSTAQVNNKINYHMCSSCCLTFINKDSLDEHAKLHHSETQLNTLNSEQQKTCHICGEQLITTFDLNLHLGEHMKNPYACKDCGQCFVSRKDLAKHNQSHRNMLNNEVSDASNQKPTSLLTSNLYFNELVKNVSRRRRPKKSKKLQ